MQEVSNVPECSEDLEERQGARRCDGKNAGKSRVYLGITPERRDAFVYSSTMLLLQQGQCQLWSAANMAHEARILSLDRRKLSKTGPPQMCHQISTQHGRLLEGVEAGGSKSESAGICHIYWRQAVSLDRSAVPIVNTQDLILNQSRER